MKSDENERSPRKKPFWSLVHLRTVLCASVWRQLIALVDMLVVNT